MILRFKRFVATLALAILVPGIGLAADALPDHYKALYFDAARDGRVDLLGGMIKDGVPVDLRDEHGYTALILAAYDEQPAAVDFLLSKQADPCATDIKGDNALMGVAFKGQLAIAQRLVTLCDVNARNHEGQTAAMMATLFGHTDIVRLLAQRGADLSLKDVSGNTADSLARQQGNAAMIALLAELRSAPPAHAANGQP
jgi:ankyrin repeat protein